MRNSRVIALVIASLVSTASVAQAQVPAPADRHARQERVKMKGDGGARGVHGGRGRGGMLKGIALSQEERTKLSGIRAKYRTEGQPARTSLRPARLELRAARLKGDTAAMKALRDRHAGARTQLEALHARQVTEMRGALSAENQRVFDANVATGAARRAEGTTAGKGGRQAGRKGMKGGHRGHPRGRRAGANG